MEARRNGKLKILYIADILRQYSDEEHPMTATEICDRLREYGVSAERKAVYDDIENLIFYGFDIIKTRSPRAGFFMASRQLEIPEIYLLTDAVQAADFITPKKTRELVDKLDAMLSRRQAVTREKSVYIENPHKCDNEEIYYSIDCLRQAIEDGKKVSLTYCTRKLGEDRRIAVSERAFTVSPYALIWMEDHYYLVCNNEKYDNLMHLRLDRMKSVREDEQPVRPFREVSDYTEFFDTADYAFKTFNMFGGDRQQIELRCSADLLEQVIDRFSDKIFIKNVGDGKFSFTTEALVSDGLVGWITQFGDRIEAVSPPALRRRIREQTGSIARLYEKD